MVDVMAKVSLEELKGQVAAGQYAVDSGVLAGDILSKFDLIRRVSRQMIGEAEADLAGEAGRVVPSPRRRGARSGSPSTRTPRGERLP